MPNEEVSYQEMVEQTGSALARMEEVCGGLEMRKAVQTLAVSRTNLRERRFVIGFLGEFKRGRSTLINALLGKEILPADILPCTAAVTRVTYDTEPWAELVMKDGGTRRIAVEELREHITGLTPGSGERAAQVKEAVVHYPSDLCENGVEIVDTPGLNNTGRMNRDSRSVTPTVDAIIMVLAADSPFSVSEAAFIRDNIMTGGLKRLILVVNKIDTVARASNRSRLIEAIRCKVHDVVREGIAGAYGKDSQRYRDAEWDRLGIRLLPLSARTALAGSVDGDPDLVRHSGLADLRETLAHMLGAERAALELSGPIGLLRYTAREAEGIIASRRGAINMTPEAFKRIEKSAYRQIEQLRGNKEHERRRLRSRARELEGELVSRARRLCGRLEDRMYDVAERWFETHAVPEEQQYSFPELRNLLARETDSAFSAYNLRTMVELRDAICRERTAAASFAGNVSREIDKICEEFSGQPRPEHLIRGSHSDYFPSEYELMRGIHPHPIWPPELTGRLVHPLGALWPVMVQLHPAEPRRVVRERISQAFRDLREERVLESRVEKLVEERFRALSAALDEICERILTDYESALEEMSRDIVQSAEAHRALHDKLSGAQRACDAAIKSLEPVSDRLRAHAGKSV